MTDDQARETPLYSFMPTGSHELRVTVHPGSVEMHCDGRVIRKPIAEWMKDCVSLSESVSKAERMAEALRFYADRSNYYLPANFNPMRPVLVDGGERARQALPEAPK